MFRFYPEDTGIKGELLKKRIYAFTINNCPLDSSFVIDFLDVINLRQKIPLQQSTTSVTIVTCSDLFSITSANFSAHSLTTHISISIYRNYEEISKQFRDRIFIYCLQYDSFGRLRGVIVKDNFLTYTNYDYVLLDSFCLPIYHPHVHEISFPFGTFLLHKSFQMEAIF